MKRSSIVMWVSISMIILMGILGIGKLDYEISVSLINQQSIWAKIFEMFGELPFTVGLLTFVVIIYGGHKRGNKVKSTILGIICWPFIGMFSYLAIMMPIHYYYGDVSVPVGINILHYVLTVGAVVAIILVYRKYSPEQLRAFRKPALYLLTVIFAEILIVNVLKIVWARPRMRSLASADEFKTWWQIGGPLNSEEFKSFPSGHSANAIALLAFAAFIPEGRKVLKSRFTIFAILWGILTALSRVVIGAHFLSDVIAAILIVMGIMAIAKKIYKV